MTREFGAIPANEAGWPDGVPSAGVITSVNTTYTVLATDYTVKCSSPSQFVVTLLTAVGRAGQVFNIKNSGAGSVVIATTSAQTIDGQASGDIILTQYNNLTVQSDGANWIIL
jgi:hypothetical protein